MDTTETDVESSSTPELELALLPQAQHNLYETGKWTTFLGIAGFILSGIVALFGLFFGSLRSIFSSGYSHIPIGAGFGLGAFYIILAILHFFISLYLYRFGTRIKVAVQSKDPALVSDALANLKQFFQIVGILVILTLAIYALLIIIGVGVLMMRSRI